MCFFNFPVFFRTIYIFAHYFFCGLSSRRHLVDVWWGRILIQSHPIYSYGILPVRLFYDARQES